MELGHDTQENSLELGHDTQETSLELHVHVQCILCTEGTKVVMDYKITVHVSTTTLMV